MLPVAVTASKRTHALALAAIAFAWFVPHDSVVAAIATIALAALLALGSGIAFAHLIAYGAVAHEGDWLELHDGERVRVRAVRWWYTVVDTFDGGTLLIPNAKITARRTIGSR